MMLASIICAHCHKPSLKERGDINRARKAGLALYCNRVCAGLARRDGKTKAQRVEEKRLYDIEYRRKNRAILKAKKAAAYQQNRDPEKERAYRKAHMGRHLEYCRRPEYRAYKKEYDKYYRAKEFGPFAEAYMLTIDLNREIKGRMTNEQIAHANGTQNKTQRRRRATAEEPQRSRPRCRARRPSHSAAHS